MTIKKVLYFLAGHVATGPEQTAIDKIVAAGPSYALGIRNGFYSPQYGAGPEAADYVAGSVPSDYQAAPAAADWRLLFHTNNGDSAGVKIGDIEWYTVPGTDISSTRSTAAVSSQPQGDAASLYDGNHPQYWGSTGIDGQWASIRFPAAVKINQVLLWGASQSGLRTGFPATFDVQYSLDGGTTWITAWAVTGGTIATDAGSQVFTSPAYGSTTKAIYVPVLDVDNIPTQNLLATQAVIKSGQKKSGVTGSGTFANFTVAAGVLTAVALTSS